MMQLNIKVRQRGFSRGPFILSLSFGLGEELCAMLAYRVTMATFMGNTPDFSLYV